MTETKIVHILHVPASIAPDKVVYIGRANGRYRLKGSKWANPFRIGPDGDRAEVIAKHRAWLREPAQQCLWGHLHELRGKALACFCWPNGCHAQNYIEAIDELYPGEYAGVSA
jgi:hypothetical protein